MELEIFAVRVMRRINEKNLFLIHAKMKTSFRTVEYVTWETRLLLRRDGNAELQMISPQTKLFYLDCVIKSLIF